MGRFHWTGMESGHKHGTGRARSLDEFYEGVAKFLAALRGRDVFRADGIEQPAHLGETDRTTMKCPRCGGPALADSEVRGRWFCATMACLTTFLSRVR